MDNSIFETAGYRLPSPYGEFMELEIGPIELWYEIEGIQGSELIPLDVIGELHSVETRANGTMDMVNFNCLSEDEQTQIGQYCNGEIETVSIIMGSGYRLSASGYMDCTDWGIADNEEQAREELQSMYPDAFTVEVYRVTFVAHCGMVTFDRVYPTDELSEARQWIARRIRRARNDGFEVCPLAESDSAVQRWEFTEPDDYSLVPDTAGILRLASVNVYPHE